MNELWIASDVERALQIETDGWRATSVSIDSRTIEAGALYVALIGERVDGHDYVKDALDKGAIAAIVSKPLAGVPPKKLVMVKNTQQALNHLGIAARKRSNAKIIGVTGSIGKTTTKEMLALMCQKFGKTYATKGNLNNHFGVPLTLANMPRDTAFAVIEMGMNHAGEISALSQMVQPHIAVITTVEAVHLEFFETVGDIADAKSEIFNGLSNEGIAVLNRDNEYFVRCKKQAESFEAKRIVSFGRHDQAEVKLVMQVETDVGVALTVNVGSAPIAYSMQASGEGPVMASLAALAVADVLQLDIHTAAKTLAAFTEVDGRGKLTEVKFSKKIMWWMDDSYNAGPASMKAAFKKLADVTAQKKTATRSVAVLGDMLELGANAPKFHAELADVLKVLSIDKVYAAGELIGHAFDLLPASMQGAHVKQAAELAPILQKELAAGDVVLFKGSHGSNIYQLVATLQSATKSP